MKKKIIVLFLLILAGMWVITSENGWCRMAPRGWRWGPGVGHHGWEEDIMCARIVAPNEPSIESVSIYIDSSTTSAGKNLLKGGGETSTNSKKKEKNPGQVNKL